MKRIVLQDIEADGELMQLPTCTDLLELSDALRIVIDGLRLQAQTTGRAGHWQAVTALQASLYDIHAAASGLAEVEGLYDA